ncbi:isomerizing glutamine--fructose-6-phosphate transaminase [Trichocoleus sp. FACHB-262]|uniref:isomerizing glutamine--fructose-6-phosphate transaminase n=1 Tax=Trichocoleus sp. FACHB-262 TaxID=2692869 RepID=UPI0016893C94|nr:isomerizing glutamine--fructose-6-phosphate transaminase [Trichocoleus sp. FACHB-262]MBD2122586.1 isomerizing glutamine--fructose-6-phosphate transaminase [Trichocoleus sp. FACHB-262]
MLDDRPEFRHLEFRHFMLKEIYEQPDVVWACLEKYLNLDWTQNRTSESPIHLGLPANLYNGLAEIHIVACGTSLHASLVGQYWLEQLAGIPTRVRYASEFPDHPFPLTANTLTIAVTQSGETSDTLKALTFEQQRRSQLAISCRPRLLGLTNQPDSTLQQRVDHILHAPSEQEVGVAATKSFVAQLIVFYTLALDLACRRQTLSSDRLDILLRELERLPEKISQILAATDAIAQLAKELVDTQDFIFLARGINYPIALEGALKLKETSYIHAEGYAAGEFLHGPIAILDEQVTVVAIAMPGQVYDKTLANLQKVKSRGARLIGITTPENSEAAALFDSLLPIPEVDELLSPILTVIPLQLLAYYITVYRGLDVDRPRGLTKSLSAE